MIFSSFVFSVLVYTIGSKNDHTFLSQSFNISLNITLSSDIFLSLIRMNQRIVELSPEVSLNTAFIELIYVCNAILSMNTYLHINLVLPIK